jgi:hypothetical protein
MTSRGGTKAGGHETRLPRYMLLFILLLIVLTFIYDKLRTHIATNRHTIHLPWWVLLHHQRGATMYQKGLETHWYVFLLSFFYWLNFCFNLNRLGIHPTPFLPHNQTTSASSPIPTISRVATSPPATSHHLDMSNDEERGLRRVSGLVCIFSSFHLFYWTDMYL